MQSNLSWLLPVAVCATIVGCGGSSDGGSTCKDGSERCRCYGNATCDDGLVCLSETCVRDTAGAAADGGDAAWKSPIPGPGADASFVADGTPDAATAVPGSEPPQEAGIVGPGAEGGAFGSDSGTVSRPDGGAAGGTRADGGEAGPGCVAQCLARQCGTVPDTCGGQLSCGTCSTGQICTGEGRCTLPGTIDDFGSCDRNIYDVEGRSGAWYFYRGTDVDCDLKSCEGVSAPPWGDSCGAWIAGGMTGSVDVYAGMGFGFNGASTTYSVCNYTSIEVKYASDQAVRAYVKYNGTGSTAPREYLTLPETTGAATASIPLTSSAFECSKVTELQFEPTRIADGFGIAVYSVRLMNPTAVSCAPDAKRCTATGGLEVCQNGAWVPSACATGETCLSDRCLPNTATPVQVHGHLSVVGTHLVDQYGAPVQLRGVSSQWLNYEGDGYATNPDALIWMRDHWKLSLIRAAMGINAPGGYLDSAEGKASMLRQVEAIIQNAVNAGVYVLVDWHTEDAYTQQADAVAFFSDIVSRYGSQPNVLFETFNEPLAVDWSSVLIPYHKAVVNAIRQNDPDNNPNVTILGTPNWDQDADVAAQAKLDGANLMYTVHFYSCDHNASSGHLGKAQTALNNGLPIFVTEWGATTADGGKDGTSMCTTQADAWHSWMNANKISWAAWKLDDCDGLPVADTSCQLTLDAPLSGGWTSTALSPYGAYVVQKMSQ